MAFLENPFALLNDTEGDNAELSVPIAVKAEKNNSGNKKNNQQKRQSSLAPNQPRTVPVLRGLGRSETGRGGTGRGSANGNGFHGLDNRKNGVPQNNILQSNGGQENGLNHVKTQYGRNGYGYHHNRQGNGYHKVNRHEDQILEGNQQVKSQVHEKLAEGDSLEDVPHQIIKEEGGWNFVGNGRASGGRGRGTGRGGGRGNGSWRNQFSSSSRFSGTTREKDEVSVQKPKEYLHGETSDSDDKSVTVEGEETTEISSNAELRQRNFERITRRSPSEELIKEDKKVNATHMTLLEYEKQLIEKRKALEALKSQERKVTLDEDFNLMQLVGRNKDDFATKFNSEKESAEVEERIEQVRLNKEDRPKQHERLRRSMSTDVFLKVFKRSDPISKGCVGYRRDFRGDDRGHDQGRGFSRNVKEAAAPSASGKTVIPSSAQEINIQDSEHFPGLSAIAKV